MTRAGKYMGALHWNQFVRFKLNGDYAATVQREIARRQLHTLLLDAEYVLLLINVTAFL